MFIENFDGGSRDEPSNETPLSPIEHGVSSRRKIVEITGGRIVL
ncbi:hypothetical protein [Bradyrhizobium monzae]|nr:hypothetical protein [Bradyrhizobium sp. Oc8]